MQITKIQTTFSFSKQLTETNCLILNLKASRHCSDRNLLNFKIMIDIRIEEGEKKLY